MAGRVLILGHPRTGTLYTAIVLRAIGLDVGHERDHACGAVSGLFYGPKWDFKSYDHILHQVKNPIKAISSITKIKGETINHILDYCGTLGKIKKERGKVKNRLLLAMLSWDSFTDWADSIADTRYKIENIKDYFLYLLVRFGVESNLTFPSIPENINSIRHKDYTYEEMIKADKKLAEKIKKKARQYGYVD